MKWAAVQKLLSIFAAFSIARYRGLQNVLVFDLG